MKLIDRYLLIFFFKVLLICFASLFGLFVIIDAFSNLDEFITYGKTTPGGTPKVLLDYYGPRALQLFDRTSGLLAMIAVAFAISWLRRTSELIAMTAAGISPARAVLPLLIAALMVALLGAANREFGLPRVRDKLARNAQDWMGNKFRQCTPRYDLRSDILIGGRSTVAEDRRIVEPQFRLPPEMASWGRLIVAERANHEYASAEHPAGYRLRKVTQPAELSKLASLVQEGETMLFSPADTPWLAPGECFVPSVVTFEQLTVGSGWRLYLSSYELVTGLRQRSVEGADVRVTLHARLLQPLLDLSLVLLGLPLVLGRSERKIYWAAALCAGIMGIVYAVQIVCHGLGGNYLLDPTVAAWTPLVIFGPAAFVFSRPLWD